MLSFALKEEERIAKERVEDKLFPLWLAHYALAKMQDSNAEVMNYDEFMHTTLDSDTKTPKKAEKKRTSEDIIAELMPFVEADKMKGG